MGAAVGPLLASFLLLRPGYQWSLVLCAAGLPCLAFVSDRSNWSFRRPIGLASAAFGRLGSDRAWFSHHRDDVALAYARHSSRSFVKKIEGPSDTYQLLRYDLSANRIITSSWPRFSCRVQAHRAAYMRMFAYLPLVSVGIRRRAAYLLRVWLHGGRASSWATRQENGCRGHFEEVLGLADFYSGIIIPIPCAIRACTLRPDGGLPPRKARDSTISFWRTAAAKSGGSVNLIRRIFSLMNSRLKRAEWPPFGSRSIS